MHWFTPLNLPPPPKKNMDESPMLFINVVYCFKPRVGVQNLFFNPYATHSYFWSFSRAENRDTRCLVK